MRFAVIGNVPVQFFYSGGYYIRPDYIKGDLVWVSYATFDIEYGLNNLHDDVSAGVFSRENASVVFGIAPENFDAPSSFKDDGILIGHRDRVKLQICGDDIKGKGNKFSWDGDFEIKNATEPAVLGNTLATILNNFCTTLSSIAPGDPAANAAALGIIKAAASTLQGGLESIKTKKVKIL